ncbi:MAG: carboxymuconolactone decarboxylase family protein [Pseudobdellovibrionaceae bacterium]
MKKLRSPHLVDNMQNEKNDIFQVIQDERNGVASIHTAFQNFPEGVSAHYQLYKQILLADGLPLSRAERELLAVKTSEANKCPYCIGHHQSALNNQTPNSITQDRADALQNLAETLTLAMWKASALKESFLAVGFSEAEWQHAVMVVSYFNFVNRCAHAMDLELEENYQVTCGN